MKFSTIEYSSRAKKRKLYAKRFKPQSESLYKLENSVDGKNRVKPHNIVGAYSKTNDGVSCNLNTSFISRDNWWYYTSNTPTKLPQGKYSLQRQKVRSTHIKEKMQYEMVGSSALGDWGNTVPKVKILANSRMTFRYINVVKEHGNMSELG